MLLLSCDMSMFTNLLDASDSVEHENVPDSVEPEEPYEIMDVEEAEGVIAVEKDDKEELEFPTNCE